MIRQIFRVLFVMVVFLGFITYALSLMVAGWTNHTDFAINITGPMICPANTTVRIDAVETFGNGTSYKTMANHFDCVKTKGDIVANKSDEQKNLWNLLLPISSTILVAVLSLSIAIPTGMVMYKNLKPANKKKK
jgi:hypothetical protein